MCPQRRPPGRGGICSATSRVTVNSGDRLAIVGINGTGKSTLIRVLTGVDTPEAGTVRFGGGVRIAVFDQDPQLPAGPVRTAVGDQAHPARAVAAGQRTRGGLAGARRARPPGPGPGPAGSGHRQTLGWAAQAGGAGPGAGQHRADRPGWRDRDRPAGARRAHQPSRPRSDRLVGGSACHVQGRPGPGHPRPPSARTG